MPAERRERRPSGRAGPRGRRPGVAEREPAKAPWAPRCVRLHPRPAVALRPSTPAARQAQGRPALRPGSNYFRGRKGLPPPPSFPLPCPRSAAGGAGSAAGQRAAHRGCRAQGLHSEPTRTLSQSHAAASVYDASPMGVSGGVGVQTSNLLSNSTLHSAINSQNFPSQL